VLVSAAVAAAVVALAWAVLVAPHAPLTSALLRDALILLILAVIAEQMAVEVSERVTLTAGNLPIVLAIMFVGWPIGVVVGFAVGAWGSWRESSIAVASYNAANYGLSAFLASLAFTALRGFWGFPLDELSVELLVCGAAASAVFEVSNMLFSSVGMRVKYGRSIRSFWLHEMWPFLRSVAVLTLVALVVAAVYALAGVLAMGLLFIPLFASQYMFKLLVREKDHLAKQKELSDRYLEMNIGLAAAMVVLLDSKDEYTAQHSAAVAMYCRDMAAGLDLSEKESEALHLAGLLHDLGKVGTPDAVLGKTAKLTDEDWDFLHQHPEKGAEVLSHLANYQDVADIVRYHHERLDGSGYPRGVTAEQIPELSKILAVADSYHAMTSDRPYREAMSSFEAMNELRHIAGVTLDRRYVEILAQILRDKDLAYRDGTSTDFMVEYERGRINLRLRGRALADISGLGEVRQDPAVS
jgi:putative nucleotidyltransferase with HDIG domain